MDAKLTRKIMLFSTLALTLLVNALLNGVQSINDSVLSVWRSCPRVVRLVASGVFYATTLVSVVILSAGLPWDTRYLSSLLTTGLASFLFIALATGKLGKTLHVTLATLKFLITTSIKLAATTFRLLVILVDSELAYYVVQIANELESSTGSTSTAANSLETVLSPYMSSFVTGYTLFSSATSVLATMCPSAFMTIMNHGHSRSEVVDIAEDTQSKVGDAEKAEVEVISISSPVLIIEAAR